MKKISLFCIFAVAFLFANSQVLKPVSWSYSAKKTGTGEYELHLTAAISAGWHIYSQTTPEGGPFPTAVSFSKNPLVIFQAGISENGKMEQRHEPLFGVDVKQFSGKVDFVQKIKLKGKAKTSVLGSIEFMVCNDTQCLPPSQEKFSISLK